MPESRDPGPFHVTVRADVQAKAGGRLAGRSDAEVSQLLAELIRRHAWEAGLDVVDPQSVQVDVARRS